MCMNFFEARDFFDHNFLTRSFRFLNFMLVSNFYISLFKDNDGIDVEFKYLGFLFNKVLTIQIYQEHLKGRGITV